MLWKVLPHAQQAVVAAGEQNLKTKMQGYSEKKIIKLVHKTQIAE
jgi:hypothetical protein